MSGLTYCDAVQTLHATAVDFYRCYPSRIYTYLAYYSAKYTTWAGGHPLQVGLSHLKRTLFADLFSNMAPVDYNSVGFSTLSVARVLEVAKICLRSSL